MKGQLQQTAVAFLEYVRETRLSALWYLLLGFVVGYAVRAAGLLSEVLAGVGW